MGGVHVTTMRGSLNVEGGTGAFAAKGRRRRCVAPDSLLFVISGVFVSP